MPETMLRAMAKQAEAEREIAQRSSTPKANSPPPSGSATPPPWPLSP